MKFTLSSLKNYVKYLPLKKQLVAGVMVAAVLISGVSAVVTTEAAKRPVDMTVYQSINPRTQKSILTVWESEVKSANTKHGFTDTTALFTASATQGENLVPVYRIYNPKTGDFTTTRWWSEVQSAQKKYGYRYNGISFYVNAKDTAETEPLYRFLKGSTHRFAFTEAQRSALAKDGWKNEGIAYYVKPVGKTTTPVKPTPAPAPTPAPVPTPTTPSNVQDGKFTIAIFPDTQQEAMTFSDDQFARRTQDIANKKDSLDIRFVGHTGDLVSTGGNTALDPQNRYQYTIASNAYKTIDATGIPYLMSIGNHDTAAVCGGGGACGGAIPTWQLIRDTSVFNQEFSVNRLRLAPSQLFEKNKVDNAYRTFSAEGTNWLVLTLEMAPRAEAVSWAQQVVQAHPRHNVVILSHYLLEGNAQITGSNAGYGSTSGRYVYDNLILKYPNVKMAFSGHVGDAGSRVDTGKNGNMVPSFLGTFHSNNFNPTRFVTIDTKNNTVTSKVEASSVRKSYLKAYPGTTVPSYSKYDITYSGMNFVK